MIATGVRGRQVLDIDFNGGTSIVFSLDKGLPPEQVRSIVSGALDKDADGLPIQTSLTTIEIRDYEKNSVYKLDVSLKDVKEVTTRLVKGFSGDAPAKLVTFDLEVKPVAPTQSSNSHKENGVRLVAFQGAEVKSDAEVQAANTPADAAGTPAVATAPQEEKIIKSNLELRFKNSKGAGTAKVNAAQVTESLMEAAAKSNLTLVESQVELLPIETEKEKTSGWVKESGLGFSNWTVGLPFDSATALLVTDNLRTQLQSKPVFQSVSKIESRVAGEMQQRAITGLLLSLVFIIAYIWFRFQKIAYGIAAVIALLHDILITLAFISVSHWLFQPLGFLLIEDFKISLTTIAGFLTIIGYSLNDTIVVFDRIREVKGKSPNLTEKAINASVTQTLSRTLLTSSTTIVAILLMYIFGGEGIHGFAYCLLVGIVVGTFSSIFIASPILLWFVQREQAAKQAAKVNG